MNRKKLNRWLTAATLVVSMLYVGCSVDYPSSSSPTLPRITNGANAGSADFTKFVTVGNSLTAGYQSSGLAGKFQINSYPAQIARQLGMDDAGAIGSDFEQPIANDSGTAGILVLNYAPTGPVASAGASTATTFLNTLLARPYDNMAVPGAFVYDFTNATSSANSWSQTILSSNNPLFDAILRGSGNQSAQVAALNPTFVIWWEGHNDILGYATRGAGVNTTPGAAQGAPIWTPRSSAEAGAFGLPGTFIFENFYRSGLNALLATGADVIVGNIPDVTAIPYFTTVYPSTNIPTRDSIITSVVTGAKARLYYQEEAALPYDTIAYLLLPVSSLIGSTSASIGDGNALGVTPYGLHPLDPIQGRYTLTNTEVAHIQSIIASYNATIDSIATNRGVHVVDFYTFFNDIKTNGITVDMTTSPIKPTFLAGGLFSLDGVHPSSFGYSVVANKWIEQINLHFGSSIPEVNINRFVNVK